MRQIALPLDELRPGNSSSLIITESNSQIAAALCDSGNWPGRCAILCGPARSGKSLLARYFTAQADGEIIDNADRLSEEHLFNAWNRAQDSGLPLLLISRFLPSDWEIKLADLRSRLGSALLLQISPPDDELLGQLIQKHMADRGTSISVDVLAYIVRRIERSFAAIEKFARDANAMALAENSAVTMGLVKKLL